MMPFAMHHFYWHAPSLVMTRFPHHLLLFKPDLDQFDVCEHCQGPVIETVLVNVAVYPLAFCYCA